MRILLLHDIFRSEVFGLGGANRVGAFWHALLGPKLARLGHRLERPAAFVADRSPALGALAARHGLAPDPGSWVRLYSDPALLPLVAEVLAPWREVDLVLGWELPPNVMRALLAAGTPFIDASIDSIRFCADLFLRLRSSAPRYADALAALEVPDAVPRAEAERLASGATPHPGKAAVLFAGQMPIDASLIRDGAVAVAADFAGRIAALAEGRHLLLKPHPHAAPHADIRALHAAIPDSVIVPDPVYALLAAPWVRAVVTLSSSVADEAELFGKTAHRLIVPDAAPARMAGVSRFHRVDAGFMTQGFWDRVLSRRPARGAEPEVPERSLRRIFSYDWGWGARADHLPERRIGPGAALRFARGADGAACLGFGWSGAEEWGVWSDGALATLLLRPDPAPAGLVLRLEAMGFVPDPAHPPCVTIASRPAGVAQRVVLGATLPGIEIALPAALCGRGLVEIVLRFAGVASPAETGGADDTRRLGLGLIAMTVR